MWTLLSVPREEGSLFARVRHDDAMGVCERYFPRDGLVHVESYWFRPRVADFRSLESECRPGVATIKIWKATFGWSGYFLCSEKLLLGLLLVRRATFGRVATYFFELDIF